MKILRHDVSGHVQGSRLHRTPDLADCLPAVDDESDDAAHSQDAAGDQQREIDRRGHTCALRINWQYINLRVQKSVDDPGAEKRRRKPESGGNQLRSGLSRRTTCSKIPATASATNGQ